MKLSKQERIALIVIVVLVILAAGVFILIKPKIETISDTKATLSAKEKEYNEAVAKAARKDGLKTDILAAYDKGKDMADMFYSELPAYEADKEIRAFLDGCDANILVEELSVTPPGTAELSTSVYVPADVKYALKDYVNQGNSASAENLDPRVIRQAAIQLVLGEPQTIGATTVTLHIKAETKEELMKFADALNNYVKKENGKSVRKAVELDNLTFTDVDVDRDFQARIEEAVAALNIKDDQRPGTPATPDDGGNAAPGQNNEDEEVVPLYEYTCTVTFYSIERMQDPTATLNEQDAAA